MRPRSSTITGTRPRAASTASNSAAPGPAGPAVERVAPALARRAEEVGRHAGHHGRPAGRVQEEEVLVGPHVGAVMCHEYRDVADQTDAVRVGITLQRAPLLEEEVLGELLAADR